MGPTGGSGTSDRVNGAVPNAAQGDGSGSLPQDAIPKMSEASANFCLAGQAWNPWNQLTGIFAAAELQDLLSILAPELRPLSLMISIASCFGRHNGRHSRQDKITYPASANAVMKMLGENFHAVTFQAAFGSSNLCSNMQLTSLGPPGAVGAGSSTISTLLPSGLLQEGNQRNQSFLGRCR